MLLYITNNLNQDFYTKKKLLDCFETQNELNLHLNDIPFLCPKNYNNFALKLYKAKNRIMYLY